MDIKALFKINCGLFIAGAELDGRLNACVFNTMMQQSHVPIRVSITLQKTNFTHDMVEKKRSVAVSALSKKIKESTIRHFGFQSGRDVDKFRDFPYKPDVNGNPLLYGEEISAEFSLKVYDSVDLGTHTLFLCTVDDMADGAGLSTTYTEYQTEIKGKISK